MPNHHSCFPFPVDAVYTWVDGNDPQWIAQREALLARSTTHTAPPAEALSPARFTDNEELRFSLRSLARFAPWIRRVHIITANQKPAWVNEKTVSIVDHSAIFPPEVRLPVFSNRPIELCAHRVPGLAEHFLYFNDDFMLGNTVTPEDFFTTSGQPRIWAVRRGKKTMQRILETQGAASTHSTAISRAHQAAIKRYGKTFPISMRHFPKTMTVSTAHALWQEFPEEVAATLASPFRSAHDITVTMLYPLSLLATQKGILRPINGMRQLFDFLQGRLAHVGASLNDEHIAQKIAMIRRFSPLTFCLNDAPSATAHDREHLKELLQQLFPEPSPFEKGI